MLAALRHGVIGSFGGQHAAFDDHIRALDATDVQKARVAAQQRAARKHQLGQRQHAASGDGARAVGHALGVHVAVVVGEIPADARVRFPALEFLEGAEVGICMMKWLG